jgi:lipopolysaccharide export system protein LptA
MGDTQTQKYPLIQFGFLPGLFLALVAGAGLLPDSSSQAAAPQKARRAAASPAAGTRQTNRLGAFSWDYVGYVDFEPTDIGSRFTLTATSGLVTLTSPNRTITAKTVSVDVPKKANDISAARGSGSVKMTEVQPDGRKLIAEGESLIYRRSEGQIDVGGGVHIKSDLTGGGSVDATGQSAQIQQIQTDASTATLSGGVNLTLDKPDTLTVPGHFSGETMTLNLKTGAWRLSSGPGSRTVGTFTLKEQKKGASQ